jgi:DNA-binding transcriptional ArsR family regulator
MTEADIGFVARLLGDPTRAAMCLSLVGGEARPAGELAARAGVSAQTASNHLARLIAGRILCVEQQGRWRYYRLAGAEVGHAVEALAVLAPPLPDLRAGDAPDGAGRRLREARTCYGHLAGRLGVMLADALIAARWLEEDGRSYRLTPAGMQSLRALGIEVRDRAAQPAARRCLDWTERRPHVAGSLGTALAGLALERGWVRRVRGSRAIAVTAAGCLGFKKVFNMRWEGGGS